MFPIYRAMKLKQENLGGEDGELRPSCPLKQLGNAELVFQVGLVESAIRRCRIGMEEDQSIRLAIERERTIGSLDDQKDQREPG